ncbi:MAG: deoxyribodipyrimidine photo-lyase [Labilithrix sp.]|nr:deoxyribodipyrimidine photo-lyase [Labilithrix sp.]
MRTLVWFRGKDLRVADHAPLADAAAAGETIPLFVLDPYFFAPERAQRIPHRMQYLLESLAELAGSIDKLGSRLVVVAGKSTEVVPELARKLEVDRVVGYRWTEPVGKERDRRVTQALAEIPFDLYDGETLATPGTLLTGSGTPFAVFTPFARAFARTVEVAPPRRAPRSLPPLPKLPRWLAAREVRVPAPEDLGITPNPRIVRGGEAAARARLRAFLRGPGARYDVGRDLMGEAGTSRASQDLKFGTISARAVWSHAKEALEEHPKARRAYLNELVWREFAYDVLEHRPDVLTEPFKPAWKGFPWRDDEVGWRAWVAGTTGYPVVDASARQLLAEGFVHNRARMITASFLAKHLLIDFRLGEEHFMRFLTDGDWAANDLGWQWSTGCGVDAQPWFRVFNPVLQGARFDARGAYVRRWVPELASLGDRFIHAPWEAPAAELARAGVVLGETYPRPIVDHAFARQRFLATAKGHLG